MFTCKSPNEAEQPIVIVNDPPIVTIIPNKLSLMEGDTLFITLHAEDFKLKNGKINFGDGTAAEFNNLHATFDTTVIHLFKAVGLYNVIALFSDGDKTTTKNLNVAVSNGAPIVTLTTDKTTMIIGDTLRVTLHASDVNLSGGYIDFRDGTIINFSDLNYVFDTTIVHVYSFPATFPVTVTFNDGYLWTYAIAYIEVKGHYYAISFSTGMSWRFSYNYINDNGFFSRSERQKGVHEWKIISYLIDNQDTIFTAEQIRNDTTRIKTYGEEVTDTTYVVKDSLRFEIVLSAGSMRMSWPLHSGIHTDTIPNHTFLSSYPYKIGSAVGITRYWYSLYADQAGPIEYVRVDAYQHGPGHQEIEHFLLIDFSKP